MPAEAARAEVLRGRLYPSVFRSEAANKKLITFVWLNVYNGLARLRFLASGAERRVETDEGRGLLDRIVPPEASQHFRNAGREQLLGIRSIVDCWIRRIDDSENRAGAKREKIDIE